MAALAARFRDLDLAEEAYAGALLRAAERWPGDRPANVAAWLYRTAHRLALDQLRRRSVRERHAAALQHMPAEAEETMLEASGIPDERLRLIFVCCHPALSEETRVALTLKVVCRLSTGEIARAFLLPEPTLAQRLVRAKRKIAEAGVPFEVPGPKLWSERLSAVLSTLEIAYAKAHEDAAATGPHAGFAKEMLALAGLLAALLPDEGDVLAIAAALHFAEARRPARIDSEGMMVPLTSQDPALWNRALIDMGDRYLKRGFAIMPASPRLLRAGVHAAWCRRRSLADAPPWAKVLALYDALLALRDDPFVRLNRAVALAEVEGVEIAMRALKELSPDQMEDHLPFHAVRADLLKRSGDVAGASQAYARALELGPAPAERRWLLAAKVGRECAAGREP